MSKLNIQLEVMQGMPVTTTRRISEVFGKRHDNVLRDVQELIGAFYVNRGLLKSEETPISVISNNENKNLIIFKGDLIRKEDESRVNQIQKWFIKSTYIDDQNKQEYPEYIITKDGFTLLVMGYTGVEAVRFKIDYINLFNKMEEELLISKLKTEIKSKDWSSSPGVNIDNYGDYAFDQHCHFYFQKHVGDFNSFEVGYQSYILFCKEYQIKKPLKKIIAKSIYFKYGNKDSKIKVN